jgi:protein-disulfide isomerase
MSGIPTLRARAVGRVLAAFCLTVGTVACSKADASGRQTTAASAPSATAQPAVQAAGQPATPAAADPLRDLQTRADASRLLGPDTAMWVVMISDFQCPYCKRWHEESMARFRRDYIDQGKVRFAYLHLPLESIHPHARKEAEASLCAGVQGKFWPYAEAVFGAYDTAKGMSDVSPLLTRFARDLSLDLPAFEQCRQSPAIRNLVTNDIAQATQAGVQSTPSFIIGEFLVQGALPYADFSKAVDSALVVAKNRKARGATR